MKTHTTTGWSAVITVALQRDSSTGFYDLVVRNANGSVAESHRLDSVTVRAAQLEATAWITSRGWAPKVRWSEGKGDDEAVRIFKSRLANSKTGTPK